MTAYNNHPCSILLGVCHVKQENTLDDALAKN